MTVRTRSVFKELLPSLLNPVADQAWDLEPTKKSREIWFTHGI